MIAAVVTDIEGTTSSIDFVHQTLFPYAKRHLRAFLEEHGERAEIRAQLAEVARIAGTSLSSDECIRVLEQWIDEDRKTTPLKALQGMIWRAGYERGELRGHVYPDVPAALRRWHADGLRLYVYSSGSEEAQKLIFGHSTAGDLTPLFSGYFDTRVGAKQEATSYARIASSIGVPADAILFLSDVAKELDAARTAGMRTCQLVRDERCGRAEGHAQAADFASISTRDS